MLPNVTALTAPADTVLNDAVDPVLPNVTAFIVPAFTVDEFVVVAANIAPLLPMNGALTDPAVTVVNVPAAAVTLPITVPWIPAPTYKLPVIPAPPNTCNAPDV